MFPQNTQNTEQSTNHASFRPVEAVLPAFCMRGACSTLPRARGAVAATLAARQKGCWRVPHAQPPSPQRHGPPFFSQRQATASARTPCHQPPCHMKQPEGTPWPARTVILSPRESSSLLTGAHSFSAAHISRLPFQAFASVPRWWRGMMTFREGTHRPVAQLFASWMRTAPLLETCCLWRRFARETKRNKSVFYAEQNDNF